LVQFTRRCCKMCSMETYLVKQKHFFRWSMTRNALQWVFLKHAFDAPLLLSPFWLRICLVSFPSQQQLQNCHLLHELILRTILSDLLYFVVDERLEKQCVSSYNHIMACSVTSCLTSSFEHDIVNYGIVVARQNPCQNVCVSWCRNKKQNNHGQ
jgi:hypothetical protein